MKKIIFAIILTFLFRGWVYAATYYIDFSGGADMNNGISPSTPWTHCPGDSNAKNTAGSTALTGGDTVIFKGGVAYLGQINVSSGSAGNIVTYDGNSSGVFGTGMAIIDGNYAANALGFNSTSKKYFTIQNFELRHFGDYADMRAFSCRGCVTYPCLSGTSNLPNKTGTGIYIRQSTYATIRNCYFHEIGIWQNVQPVIGDADINGYGIRVDSGDHITISNNEFTKMSYPVYLNVYNSNPMSLTNVTVSNNNFHNYIRWELSIIVNGTGSTMNGVDVYGNQFRDFTEYDAGTFNGCGPNPHTDGIIFFIGGGNPPYTNNSLGTSSSPIRIYSNTFYQSTTSGNGGTAMIFVSGWGGTTWIYNNTFVNVRHHGEGAIYVQDGTRAVDNNPTLDYHIYNNTFYDDLYAVFLRSGTSGYELNSRSGNVISVKNNIFYQVNPYSTYSVEIYDVNSRPTELDYNLYYSLKSDQTVMDWRNPGPGMNGKTLSGAQSAWEFEAHGKYGDPLFNNISYGLGLYSSLNDLHLQPLSPARNSGVSLSSYFTTDKDGVVREDWSIGAYESKSPLPPSNLKVKSSNKD